MTERPIQITIDMDKKCPECRKGGATQNGLCLGCITKSLVGKPMKSDLGRRHQAQIGRIAREARS